MSDNIGYQPERDGTTGISLPQKLRYHGTASSVQTYTGVFAYTRRRQRDGFVKVFFRDAKGRRAGWIILEASAAEAIPRNRSLTIETNLNR